MDGMKPAIRIASLTEEQRAVLNQLYRKTKLPRVRTRAQMVLLSAEQGLKAEEIAAIVRESAVTVLTWLKRYLAEGIEGLQDAPRAGRSTTVTEEFRKCLLDSVRRRPRSLELVFSMWTLQRLADYLAEKTGIRVSDETIRRELAKEGIVFSRPQHTISSPDPEYLVKKRRLKKSETV
jgi:transposase